MSPSVTTRKTCPYCLKSGLPILPLRYAVARSDMGDAPQLSAPFGAGVESIKLPTEQAHYTLRLLRAGYLYVYDERYGQKHGWKAYQVDEGGYLYPFDPYVEPPPSGWAKKHFSCARGGNDAHIARCFTVDDAATAGKIWLGFSDVLWTQETLKKHASEACRAAHMRRIDMQGVRAGTNQPHASKLTGLMTRVAEYATTPTLLYAQTQPYVKKYLPTPLTDPRQLLETSDEGTFAYQMCSKLVTGLLGSAVDAPLQKDGRYPSAPWAFSHAPLFADAELGPGMQRWAADAAKPYHPAMVAVDDPAGIAMELNGLIQQRTTEFTEEPQRKWKHETALTIQMFKQSLMDGVVKGVNQDIAQALDPACVSPLQARIGDPALGMQMRTRDALEHPDQHSPTELNRLDGWDKYAGQMSGGGVAKNPSSGKEVDATTAIVTEYQTAWKAYKQAHVLPVVDSFLAWVQAASFTTYFTHNFDRDNLYSGQAFTEVLGAVFDGLGGHAKVVDHLSREMQRDPSSEQALVARAFALNQDKLVAAWVKGAQASTPKSVTGKAGTATVLASVASVYGPWDGLMTSDKVSSYRGIAKFIHRVSAAALKTMTQAPLEEGMKLLPVKRLYAVMGTVAKLENPNLVVVDMSEARTPQQAAKTLNRALGKLLGRSAENSAIQHMIGGKPRTMRAVALVDESQLRGVAPGASGEIPEEALAKALGTQSLDDAVEYTASLAAAKTGPVAGGVIGFMFTVIACRDTVREFGGALGTGNADRAGINLLGQATSLSGAAFDMTARVKDVFEARRMAAGFARVSEDITGSSKWLSGAGRVLGGVGGIIAGVAGIWQGVDDYEEGHTTIGNFDKAGGVLGIIAGVAMLCGWTGIGIVVGVVTAILMLLVAYFTPNALQDWINRSKLGVRSLTDSYKGLVPQQMALKALGG